MDELGRQGAGESGTHRQSNDVCEQGRDGGHDEDRAKADRVRVARRALQVRLQVRDKFRRVPDLADYLRVYQPRQRR